MLGRIHKSWHERQRRRLRRHRRFIREEAQTVLNDVRCGAHVQLIDGERRCASRGGARDEEQRRRGRVVRHGRGPDRRAQDRPRCGHEQTSDV